MSKAARVSGLPGHCRNWALLSSNSVKRCRLARTCWAKKLPPIYRNSKIICCHLVLPKRASLSNKNLVPKSRKCSPSLPGSRLPQRQSPKFISPSLQKMKRSPSKFCAPKLNKLLLRMWRCFIGLPIWSSVHGPNSAALNLWKSLKPLRKPSALRWIYGWKRRRRKKWLRILPMIILSACRVSIGAAHRAGY